MIGRRGDPCGRPLNTSSSEKRRKKHPTGEGSQFPPLRQAVRRGGGLGWGSPTRCAPASAAATRDGRCICTRQRRRGDGLLERIAQILHVGEKLGEFLIGVEGLR